MADRVQRFLEPDNFWQAWEKVSANRGCAGVDRQKETTVHQEQGRFLIRAPQTQTVEMPIREVEQILIFGNCQLTTQVISVCLDQRITVVYLTQMGDYKEHLRSTEAEGIQATVVQFERYQEETFRLETIRAIATRKLQNSRQLLPGASHVYRHYENS